MASTLLDDLVAFWPLTEASGQRNDVHNRGHHLTDVNTVLSATGLGNQGLAADFERTNNEYLSLAAHADFDVGDAVSWTMQFWLNLEDKGSADRNVVARPNAFRLKYDQGSDRFQFALLNGSNSTVNNYNMANFGSPSIGTWYHFLIWNDATNNLMGVRVNDQFEDTNANGTTGSTGNGQILYIGSSQSVNNPWDGLMWGVGFWMRLLTSAEKTRLFNAGRGLKYPFYTNESIRGVSRGVMMGGY